MEGFWSLLPQLASSASGYFSRETPLYLGFFEFVHNVREAG